MLTRLLPDQISKFWDIIQYSISQSLPPIVGDHPNKMNNILMSALEGSIDVWASYNRGSDGNKFEGIVLTEILYDRPSRTRNLLIYCLYGYEKVDKQSWDNGLRTLLKYASGKKCNQIVAYTDIPMLIEVVKRLCGEARYTFISFDVQRSLNDLINLEN